MPDKFLNLFADKSANSLIDVLTGCWNRIRFIDYLAEVLTDPMIGDWSVLGLDLNHFKRVNDQYGHTFGDKYLQWVAGKLKKANPRCFRYGGDEFFLVFVENEHQSHNERALTLYEELNQDLLLFLQENSQSIEGLDDFIPVATISVINFLKQDEFDIDRIITIVDHSVYRIKLNRKNTAGRTFQIFKPQEFNNIHSGEDKNWVTQHLLKRISDLNRALAASNSLALTDQVSGLPNALAAENFINNYLAKSNSQIDKLCLLFMDGDDLREYNKINYQAGDQMIRNLAGIIKEVIGEGGFLARWRRGDEFVMILPDIALENAKQCAERVRATVEERTQSWHIPITISIGLACYPTHGENLDDLLDHAEKGLTYAKQHGKNQISIAM